MPCPYFKKGQKYCILLAGRDWYESSKKEVYCWHVERGYCCEKYEDCDSYAHKEELLKNKPKPVWSVS